MSEQKALQLSRELRTAKTPSLRRRRRIVALSLLASGSMAVIAAYQTGLIRHLPEPPLPMFNADKVDASAEAYGRFSVPDAILGLGSYAATMALAAMGSKDRARETPLIPVALAAKVAFDVANAAKLSVDQWKRNHAFCFWCLLAAGATFAMLPLVVREVMTAAGVLASTGRPRTLVR